MSDALDAVLALLRERGDHRYAGEPVSHWQHALQTAALAIGSGADDALITAAWLHDIGHLIADGVASPDTPTLRGVDDLHETLGAAWLSRHFTLQVSEPIRLHVRAKRYLAATAPAYADALSDDSLRSLRLQGGALSRAECAAFVALPHAAAAVQLRRWDDAAKVAGGGEPLLGTLLDCARPCLLDPGSRD